MNWKYITIQNEYSYLLFIYSYVHTLFGPSFPPPSLPHPLASRQNLFCPLLQFCWRENIRVNKKDIAFLLVWDKDSYTERFLALLPCTCVLQTELVHLYRPLHYFLVIFL
jgi:hypothetical protein